MMKKANSFDDLFREAERHDDYWVADAMHTFTEGLCQLLETSGISRAELARRLGTSKAYVTKVMKGNVNFTIETMVRLSRAVGGQLSIAVHPADATRCRNRRADPEHAVAVKQKPPAYKRPSRRSPKKRPGAS